MIDISLYTPKKRKFLRMAQVHCVYIVAPIGKDTPIKISITCNPAQRMSSMQIGNWASLEYAFLLWCPGVAVATRIKNACHFDFISQKISGEWFHVTRQQAKLAMELKAATFFPMLRFLRHDEQIEKLGKKLIDKKDHLT